MMKIREEEGLLFPVDSKSYVVNLANYVQTHYLKPHFKLVKSIISPTQDHVKAKYTSFLSTQNTHKPPWTIRLAVQRLLQDFYYLTKLQ